MGSPQMPVKNRRDLTAPAGILSHGWQELELEHKPWHLQGDGAFDDIPGHFLIVAANLAPVRLDDVNHGQCEIHLGEYQTTSDCKLEATRYRPRRLAKDEILRVGERKGRIVMCHDCTVPK